MTSTIVETRAATGGVDTHAATHGAAVLDAIGGLLGVPGFPATPTGWADATGGSQCAPPTAASSPSKSSPHGPQLRKCAAMPG
jgi:hypothetical protein